MPRPHLLSAFLLLLLSTTITAQAAAEPNPAIWRTGSHIGLGLGFFGADDVNQPGLGFDAGARFVHRSGFTVNLIGELTLTDFARVRDWAQAGLDVADWSLGGFKTVTDWIGDGGADDTTVLRAFGGFFAYTFLTVTLIVGGTLLLFSPLASFTNFQTAMTAGYTLDLGHIKVRGEAGVGALFYFHPKDNHGYTGWGPTAGMEIDIGGYGFGIRGTYSPEPFHSSNDPHVVVATGTFRAIY